MNKWGIFLASALLIMGSAHATDVTVSDAWVKPTIPGTENGAGYVVLTNEGATTVTLIGVTSEASRAAEIHTHTMNDEGMMRMQRVPRLEIAAGETVTFQPGSYHVMFFGVKNPFRVGEQVAFQLQFEGAPAQDVVAEVRPIK
jgi:copper(I)-binding protein